MSITLYSNSHTRALPYVVFLSQMCSIDRGYDTKFLTMFHLRKHTASKTDVLLSRVTRGMSQVELELSHRYHRDEYAECASRRVITAGVVWQ